MRATAYESQETETVTTINGHKITGFKDDYIVRSIEKHGVYEKLNLDFISCVLKKLDNPVVLDIGANIGNHALSFSIDAHKVFSFEPVPSIFYLLDKNISSNSIDNVFCINAAMSDIDGSSEIGIDVNGNCGACSMENKIAESNETIVTIAGDNWIEKEKLKVDFIKIDVEGHEANVIKGLKETILRQRPFVMFEWINKERQSKFFEFNIFETAFKDYALFSMGDSHKKNFWKGRRFGLIKKSLDVNSKTDSNFSSSTFLARMFLLFQKKSFT